MIISADRIITGDGEQVVENSAVAVSDDAGLILEIAPQKHLMEKYGEIVVQYPGCTLLPGLIDLHVHLSAWGRKPFGYMGGDFVHAFVTLKNARCAFQTGVTTMRSVADKNGLVASVVWAAEHGLIELPVPRIIPCGNGICMTGGHGSEFPDGGDVVDGPWEMRKQIRQNIQSGAQWIKLLTSKREFVPEFTQEELDVAVDECHRRNHKIAVHSSVPVTIQMCIDAGVDTIEHGTFMSIEQAQEMRDRHIAWVPTIMVNSDRGNSIQTPKNSSEEYFIKATKAYRDNFKQLYDTGVLTGAGTDMPIDEYGVNTYRELEYMVEYGLPPLKAIQIGTQNGAKILDLDDVTGTVQVGLEADLLIVKGNPADTISDIRNVEALYKHGEVVYKKAKETLE